MKTTAWMLSVAVTLSFTLPLYAQEAAEADAKAPKSELQQLNQTLREIADLLKKQLDNSEIDVYLKRLELSHRRLAPLEEELRSARAEKESVEDEQEHLKLVLEQTEESAEDQGTVADEADQRMKREIEGRLEQIKGKAWKIEQRILTLENELTRRQEDVQVLENWIDERLGLR